MIDLLDVQVKQVMVEARIVRSLYVIYQRTWCEVGYSVARYYQ